MDIREYVDERGRKPFRAWFDRLDQVAARKVVEGLVRLSLDNVSNVKSIGQGLHEYRIHFGPGYRLYFGYEGPKVVVLLCGGSKRRQDNDIATARMRWDDYKRRKGYVAWH